MGLNETVLTIEKLAGLGDGLALHAGRRIFVPYTAPGDRARVRIHRRTTDADFAELTELIASRPARVAAFCPHFTVCGGCSLQHIEELHYRQFKHAMAGEALRKAGFDPAIMEPLIRLPTASRRRVELKVEPGRLGYYAARSHQLVDIRECGVLEPGLEKLVLTLKPQLLALPGLQSVHINGLDGGYDMLCRGVGAKGWALEAPPNLLRVSAQEGDFIRVLHQSGPTRLQLGSIAVAVPPGAFLQASADAQRIMTQFVCEAVGKGSKIADLFAGLGTYSFPLAAQADVTAVEADAQLIAAMRNAASAITIQQRDLFASPLTFRELSSYDAIVINPPRTGAKAQTEMLAQAKPKKIIMISCNPATFARDAKALKNAGYFLTRAVPLDQFIYSPHLEIMTVFAL